MTKRSDPVRIATLEAQLLDARRGAFECPFCGSEEYVEAREWRGGRQEDNAGEWYSYWACGDGHDVTATVAPSDGVSR